MAQDVGALASGAALVVSRFAAELRRRYGDTVVAVRVFGSYARGEANEGSDVDIAVVLSDTDGPIRRDVIDLATDIGLPADLVLSPTVFDSETYNRWRHQERPLVRDIEHEGIPA